MPVAVKQMGSAFGDRKIAIFPYGVFDAATNLALNEAMLEYSIKKNAFAIRFYDFEKLSIILSQRDHPDVIRVKDLSHFDVSRRMGSGFPILMGENTLGYTVAGPQHVWTNSPLDVTRMHRMLGPIVAETVKDMIGGSHPITLGNTASVKVYDQPIASHSGALRDKSFLYQGAIVISPWSPQKIDELLKLREGNHERISRLPSIESLALNKSDTASYKKDFMQRYLAKLPSENLTQLTDQEILQIKARAETLKKEKYDNPDWVWDANPNLQTDVDFCILFDDRLHGLPLQRI